MLFTRHLETGGTMFGGHPIRQFPSEVMKLRSGKEAILERERQNRS
jgi:hypothetical protein